MAGPKPHRRKLSQGVKERLHALIESSDLKPGDALPSERDLMGRFEVGRPAIREALQALERGGLVTIRHGGRARIAEASIEPLIDLLTEGMRHALAHAPGMLDHLKEARLAFEAEMARRAAKTRSEEDIARLRDRIAAQEAARGDPEAFLAADGAFHREVAAATGNPVFAAAAEAMFRWLAPFHVGAARAPELEQLVLDEHTAVVDQIEKERRKRAARAMSEHLTRANALYQSGNDRQRPPAVDPAVTGPAAGPPKRRRPAAPAAISSPAARSPARAARSRGPRPFR